MNFTEKENIVSVVMPSYNERENILEAIERILLTLGSQLREIIVVDDDSPDKTWELVENLKNPKCRLIRRRNEKGLTSALAEGVRAATGEVVVWLDCDLGIPPEMIPRLIERLSDSDVVIGSRYMKGGSDNRPAWRVFLSYIFNLGAGVLLGFKIRDYTSGFAAVRGDIIRKIPIRGEGFGEYFIDWAYRCIRAGVRITEIPYSYSLRKRGVSKTDGNLGTFFILGINYSRHLVKTWFVTTRIYALLKGKRGDLPPGS